MATQTLPRKRSIHSRSRSRRKSGIRWYAWWPLLLALAATPFAVKTAEILPLMGMAGLHRLCLLLPFAVLAQWRGFGFAESVSQALMYVQFPVYGLMLVLLHRFWSFAAGIISVVCVHLLAAAAAWVLVMMR